MTTRILRILILGPFALAVMAVITIGLVPALPVMWLLGLRPELDDLIGPYEAIADVVWDGIE